MLVLILVLLGAIVAVVVVGGLPAITRERRATKDRQQRPVSAPRLPTSTDLATSPPARLDASDAVATSQPSLSESASQLPRERVTRSRKPIGWLGVVVSVIFLAWLFWANQTSQQLRCVEYLVSGRSRPPVWTVTCALNGKL
jgi:hypothetical protein